MYGCLVVMLRAVMSFCYGTIIYVWQNVKMKLCAYFAEIEISRGIPLFCLLHSVAVFVQYCGWPMAF